MSYSQKATIKRIPTGRPLTPKEHDENLEAIDTTNNRVQAEFDIRMPVGGIIMWSGSSAAVPQGWALCNGQTSNGVVTPDMRGRFVVGDGAGSGYTDGQTGGNDSIGNHTHTNPNVDSHPLTPDEVGGITFATTLDDGDSQTGGFTSVTQLTINGVKIGSSALSPAAGSTTAKPSGAVGHTHSQGSTGGAGAHDNRPKFYAIAYIMFVDYTQPS